MREVANHDFDQMRRIVNWPLREVLMAFHAVMRREALAQYRTDLLAWASKTAFGGKKKPPALPDILR